MSHKSIPFTLGYEALLLLGKGMYSNIWAALSELIANGIDAHAQNVNVYIDMSNKEHSCIEIADDGDGMSVEEIERNYVVIGKNKRENAKDSINLMGRKGVGKLAALFLSKKFEFLTCKKDDEQTIWRFDISDRTNEIPVLVNIEDDDFVLKSLVEKRKHGTILKLFDVNMTNMAEEAVKGLALIMANYFIYENLPEVEVKFYVKYRADDNVDFNNPIVMEKRIAFKNMIALFSEEEFNDKIYESKFKYPLEYGEYFRNGYLEKERNDVPFNTVAGVKGIYETKKDGKNLNIPYELKGWIGIHASIDTSEARNNDKRFVKNRYYNPNKLRLYIRNKLAVEDFTSYLDNTQQGINYIEGEISFDLLDDDRLEDITTSNRQDVDKHDPRVTLLIDIVKKVVNKLIVERNSITKEAGLENKRRKGIIESVAKTNASKAIKKDLTQMGIGADKLNEVIAVIDNKFKGSDNLKAKEIFKLFISHSKKDRRFSDFIYNILRLKGAKNEDIFYTTHEVGARSKLSQNIKDNLAENNVLVLFLDSVHSLKSQYCMFEGGAFWATRSVEDCIHLHFNTSWIPDYINDRDVYHVPLNDDKNLFLTAFDITSKKYNEIIEILNVIINHLNSSITHNTNKIPLFSHVDFPSDIVLRREGKTEKDYMDKDFKECWELYVENGITDLDANGNVRTKDEFLNEYNEAVSKY